MARILLAALICLSTGVMSLAQQTTADPPATKEDVQKYLEVMHSKEMMAQMVDAMARPMHQMIHEQYLKDKENLPADFEARANKLMDDSFKTFPWDELLQSMVPVYQKHLTKGDINAIVAFYGGPTGQKLLREMPAMMAESMETMMPLLRKHMEALTDHIQQQVAQMKTESKSGAAKSPTSPK